MFGSTEYYDRKSKTWHTYCNLLFLCPGQALLADLGTFSLSYVRTSQPFGCIIQEPSQEIRIVKQDETPVLMLHKLRHYCH